MGRHSENSSDFIDLEFAGLKELCLFRRDADRRVFHAFLKNSDLICVSAAAEGGLPTFTHTLRIFDGAGVFQHATGSRTICKELGSVLLAGNRHADGVLCHSNGAVANQTVKAQAWDMQHIRRLKRYRKILIFNGFIRATIIGVVQTAVFISVHGHLVGHQRIQGDDLTFAVANDLCIGIAPQKQMGHECFTEHERTHFRVRLIMEQSVQRMVEGFFLATAISVFIKVQRKPRHSFCQNTDTGVNGSHLHSRPLCYGFACGSPAHVKCIGASGGSVFRLISGFEQTRKDTHYASPSFSRSRRASKNALPFMGSPAASLSSSKAKRISSCATE